MPQLDYKLVNLEQIQQHYNTNLPLSSELEAFHSECDSKHVHINPAPKLTILRTKKEFDEYNNVIRILYLPDGQDDIPSNWRELSPHDSFPENTFLDYEITQKIGEQYQNIQLLINSVANELPNLNFNGHMQMTISQIRLINSYLKGIIDNSTLGLRNLPIIYRFIAVSNSEINPEAAIDKFNNYFNNAIQAINQLLLSLDEKIQLIETSLKKHVVASFHLSRSIGICEKKLETLKSLRDKSLNSNRNLYLENIAEYKKRANQINLKFRQDLFALVTEKYKEHNNLGTFGSIRRFFSYRIPYYYNRLTGTKTGLEQLIIKSTNILESNIETEDQLIEELEQLKLIREKYYRKQQYLNESIESIESAKQIYMHLLSGFEDTNENIKKNFFNILADNPSLAYIPSLLHDIKKLFSHFITTPWLNLNIDYNNIRGLSKAYTLTHVNHEVRKLIEQFKVNEKKRAIQQSNYDLRKELDKTHTVETKRITNILIFITCIFTAMSVIALVFNAIDTIITKKTDNNTKWYQDVTIWLAHVSSAVIIVRSVFSTVFDIRLISIAEKTQIDKYEEDKHIEQIKKYENDGQQTALEFIKRRKSTSRDFQLIVDYLLQHSPGGNEIIQYLTMDNYQRTPLAYIKNLIKYIHSRDFYIAILHGDLPVSKISEVEFGELYKPIFESHESLFYQLYQDTLNFFEEKTLLDGRDVVLVDSSLKCSQLFKQDYPTIHQKYNPLTKGYSWLFFEIFSFVSTNPRTAVEIYRKVGRVYIKDEKFKSEVHKHTNNELFEEDINLDPILTETLLFFYIYRML